MHDNGSMTSSADAPLDELLARIVADGVLDDPVVDGAAVQGRASLEAAGAVVAVRVDPELEDTDDVDVDALLESLDRILSMRESRWRALIDEVADEIEEATADDEITEDTDLRSDLEAASLVVFADAVLVGLRAPRQFPDARVIVQLDDDLEIEDVQVDERDEG